MLHLITRLPLPLLLVGCLFVSDAFMGDACGEAPPLKAMLITGGCCHDYPRQTEIITQGLSQRANVQWTVHRYGDSRDERAAIYNSADWADGFDVIVHNECYGAVTDPQFVQRIVDEHVEKNIPAVFIHCAMHSYRNAENADAWRQLIGVTSRGHERKKHSLHVVPRDTSHPIMQGFPSVWDTPNGELYLIEQVWPQTKVLATVHSDEMVGDHPVMWVNEYEGVRAFGISLGHHNETMEHPIWLDTTARGLLWSCGKLTDSGEPAEGFAGKETGGDE